MSDYVIRKGIVKGSSVALAKPTGSAQARFLQVQFAEPEDVRNLDLMLTAGEDSCPQVGDTAFLMESGETRKSVIATRDPITPTAAAGEKEFYSYSAAGAKLARLKLKSNGQFYMGTQGGSDLLTVLLTLTGDLSTLATALTSAASFANINAAGTALTASITTLNTALNALLDNAP